MTGPGGTDYDVVVVGAGVAGLEAAIEASTGGCSVLIAEAGPSVGGSSALASGIILAAGTSVQREAGIHDTAEDLTREYLLFNQYRVRRTVASRLARGSADAVEWLVEHGIEFRAELMFAAEERAPRAHVPRGGGLRIVQTLAAVLDTRPQVDVALGQRIDRLLVEAGRVVGVAVGDDAVRAGAVVVTTGGFGANPTLWGEHLPSFAAAGGGAWYVGASGARGDAFAFASQVGAAITGHDRALYLPSPGFSRDLEPYFPGWLVMVDRSGARQIDESVPYALMHLVHRDRGPMFALFDDAARKSVSEHAGPSLRQPFPGMDMSRVPNSWSAASIDAQVRAGRIRTAQTLDDLARLLGIDAGGLERSLHRYNGHAASGADVDFAKAARFLRSVSSPPFYGVELRPSMLGATFTGVHIDADAQVLARSGTPIAGFYAAGECTGGVIDRYMGSGNAYTSALVFGRRAGAAAATECRAAG